MNMSIAGFLFKTKCEIYDTKRDRGRTVPGNIEYIEGLRYGNDPKWHTLDICRPKDRKSRATVINVHGGGYVYGSTKPYKFYCCDLAARGFTVVSFNYRLAPKYKFPAPLEDLNAVMQWVCANCEEYGLDTENIMMVGDSAGAQLASQYAAIWSNGEYADVMGVKPPKFRLAAVGLNCGMYDMVEFTKKKSGISSLLRDYFTSNPQRFGEKLRVLDYITADFPPTYLLSSKGDFLLDCCEPMAELLLEKGVPCEYKIYGDENTGHVFHVDFHTETAKQANDDELGFMSRYIVNR
ncbi:MAG: alpha/beta hydrolase [Ruminococcaceae bacterium]|nr:alpha/beta hydrolase [Oscillospiraceae bacterium]